MTTASATAEQVCAVCRRGDAPVCDRCRSRMAGQLADLPALRSRLRVALVPGQSGGERVSSTKGEAPMPARLAALSLIAGGSDEARCLFVPAVRVWTTAEAVIPYKPRVTWHRDLIRDDRGRPVMALADDQSGVLPLPAWLRSWSHEWRRSFGHSDAEPGPARARRRTAGIVHRSADDDPVADEWDARWPEDEQPATARHHAYLSTWLPEACERLPIGDFAVSLRTLTGAVRAALGDIEDLEYVGRCPEPVDAAVCGAQIWHDPYASVITCPRCRAETPNERRLWLARRILAAWPIDRRRRYPRGLIEILRTPACVTCSAPVSVEWVPATERADREPFWRPGRITCPHGCESTA